MKLEIKFNSLVFIFLLFVNCGTTSPSMPDDQSGNRDSLEEGDGTESDGFSVGSLQVDDSGHYLVTTDSQPFFWLGDTGWNLFVNLNIDEVETYFEDRKEKGFNVIQAMAFGWDLDEPNANGDLPFHERDTYQPVEEYWRFEDDVIDLAAKKGLYIALVPVWARSYIETSFGDEEDKIFTYDPQRAYDYGYFIGNRYRDKKNIIWIVGGDTWAYRDNIYEKLVEGITNGVSGGDYSALLMSFHPQGGTARPPATSSGEFYHTKPWLDFNMIQSGHRVGNQNYQSIQSDYERIPAKPTLDAEPCYEQHPVLHNFKNGVFTAWNLRRRGYWSVFAGAFGFTYGGNGIWQMAKPDRKGDETHFNYYWYEALDFEGGNQMQYLRKLMESRPFVDPLRIPDQSVLKSDAGAVDDHLQCTRGSDWSYLMIYSTNGRDFDVDLSGMKTSKINAWWYNPRDGKCYTSDFSETTAPFAVITPKEVVSFNPPGLSANDHDWVLVLDDSGRNFGVPGTETLD